MSGNIDDAIKRIHLLIEVRDRLAQREANGLPNLPGWPDRSDATLARKIVGELLDMGWTPAEGAS